MGLNKSLIVFFLIVKIFYIYADSSDFWNLMSTQDYEMIEQVLNNGYEEHKSISLYYNESPIVYAIEQRDFILISMLLEHNSVQTYNNGLGVSSILSIAMENNDEELLIHLLENGVMFDIGDDLNSGTIFDYIYLLDENIKLVDVLVAYGYDFSRFFAIEGLDERMTYSTRNVLSYGLNQSSDELLRKLLEIGLNVNFAYAKAFYENGQYCIYRYTLLDLCLQNHPEFVDTLLTYDAHKFIELNPIEETIDCLFLGIVSADGLRVRNTPGVDGEILGSLSIESEIKIICSTSSQEVIAGNSGYWYQIYFNNQIGWVFSPFVSVSNPRN